MKKRYSDGEAKRAAAGNLLATADAFKRFRPASQVLTSVRAVPTRFVQFDHAVRVGGWPVERFSLVHGPSNEGKTLFILGLIFSFLTLGFPVLFIDAERTTPIEWVRELLGSLLDSPIFFARKPESYEQTIAEVRDFLTTVAKLNATRLKAGLPPLRALVVVDSLRKLVPKDLLAEIMKAEKEDSERVAGGKVKAGRDRGAQIKAKMNAAWMDEVVPLLEHAGAGMVAIAREMVDPDNTNDWARKAGTNYRVGGGGAIYYDASIVVRVERDGWVQKKSSVEGERATIYGERHRLTIKKTKVAGKDDKVVVCHFHSSNGTLTPSGFDRARDVLEMAERWECAKWVKKRGGGESLAVGGERYRTVNEAVVALSKDAAALSELEGLVRGRFEHHKPVEHDEDGVVA
jgi:RecA/RadA recombinase